MIRASWFVRSRRWLASLGEPVAPLGYRAGNRDWAAMPARVTVGEVQAALKSVDALARGEQHGSA